MAKKPLVIVTRKLPGAVEARMAALFDAKLNASDTPFSAGELREAMRTADVLAPAITDRIDAGIVEAAGPGLRLIANFGAGTDHVDLAALRARGLSLTNTPGVLTEDTADLTMALILGVPRRIAEGLRTLEGGGFKGWFPTWMMGKSLNGMKLGIVGMGRIGRAVARRARSFGMEIHYHNRKPVPDEASRALAARYWADLDAMLPQMDMVSLNCPSTKETWHLMSAARLGRMRKDAYLINTARGDIVDEAALADALAKGMLAGAGLDVFEHEPKIHPGLIGLENVMLLPHLGSGTIEARTAMGDKVIANIEAFVRGEPLPDRVV